MVTVLVWGYIWCGAVLAGTMATAWHNGNSVWGTYGVVL